MRLTLTPYVCFYAADFSYVALELLVRLQKITYRLICGLNRRSIPVLGAIRKMGPNEIWGSKWGLTTLVNKCPCVKTSL